MFTDNQSASPIPQYTDFVYPEEMDDVNVSTTPEINEFIVRFSLDMVKYKNPKLAVFALLYACNFDLAALLNCNRSMRSISKVLGCSCSVFSRLVKRMRCKFNIQHTNKTYTNPASKAKLKQYKGKK